MFTSFHLGLFGALLAWTLGASASVVGLLLGLSLVSEAFLGRVYKANREDRVHLKVYPDRAIGIDYEYPKAFFKYSIVYDPSQVTFSAYKVSVLTNRKQVNGEKTTSAGRAAPDQPGKMIIDIYPNRYNPPKSLDDPNRILAVSVQFWGSNKSALSTIEYRKYRSQDTYEKIPLGTGF
jgi:hypothetical protein